MLLVWTGLKSCGKGLTLSQMTNLDYCRLKEFADDNFKFDKNGFEFSKG